MRNQSIADFFNKLETASGGRVKTEIFAAGALFADVNVVKALIQGQVEMACPGTWTMTGFVPDFDFVSLPMLYGQPLDDARKAIDGKTGRSLDAQLKSKLHIAVIGPWLELGSQNWYSATRRLNGLADLKGMKIRNAGGVGNGWRTRFLDAIPNTTAWPDVPLALSQGTFDGLISTNESCASAKLWEAGLKCSIQDNQSMNVYVPLMTERFLSSLPGDLRSMVFELWAANIASYRENMRAAQERALATLKDHGLVTVTPSQEEISALRRRMLPDQDQLMKDMKMSPDLAALMHEDLGNLV